MRHTNSDGFAEMGLPVLYGEFSPLILREHCLSYMPLFCTVSSFNSLESRTCSCY